MAFISIAQAAERVRFAQCDAADVGGKFVGDRSVVAGQGFILSLHHGDTETQRKTKARFTAQTLRRGEIGLRKTGDLGGGGEHRDCVSTGIVPRGSQNKIHRGDAESFRNRAGNLEISKIKFAGSFVLDGWG
jgi:hypothetical protein